MNLNEIPEFQKFMDAVRRINKGEIVQDLRSRTYALDSIVVEDLKEKMDLMDLCFAASAVNYKRAIAKYDPQPEMNLTPEQQEAMRSLDERAHEILKAAEVKYS